VSDTHNNSASSSGDPATAQVDVQDPLPETNWFWRRVYTFVLSLVSVALIWYGLESVTRAGDMAAVYKITRYMIGVHVLLITFYMVAPSAEQMVKLIQAAKLLQAGVPVTRRATVETPQGGRTEVETTAGHTETPEAQNRAPEPPQAEEQDFAPRSNR
jgi:hypothetical protein